MEFQNVHYYGEDFRFHFGDVAVEKGRIAALREKPDCGERKRLLLPGFVDLHLHGNSGLDFSDDGYEGLCTMARFLAAHGTTSFSPASMTVSEAALNRAYRAAVRLRDEAPAGAAHIVGITMEGPFFSMAKRGAQNPDFLQPPSIGMLRRLQAAADGMIRITCVAPELPGAEDFIREAAAAGVVVSVAHTEADYETASRAFELGARHVTHLCNGMPPLLHRAPGVIGAAADHPEVMVELIGDGLHVHPAMVRAIFRIFGPERICLITDALAFCGMEGGEFCLGGQRVTLSGGLARLADGTIAGSTATMLDCVRRLAGMGIPLEEALRTASFNPARILGVLEDVGAIAVGRRADLLLCDGEMNLERVYLSGEAL